MRIYKKIIKGIGGDIMEDNGWKEFAELMEVKRRLEEYFGCSFGVLGYYPVNKVDPSELQHHICILPKISPEGSL